MMPSISISKGKGNFRHNTREQENSPINVDSERTKYNQTLVNRDIQQVYHELFDEPVTEYNALQVSKGHPERQINDYYKKILHDKKTKPFHELVIQVGRKGDDISLDVTNAIYHDFLREFEQNNPNLIVIGAYIHNDETTPHMHLDYVPVASYARGLKKRVANDRAIKSMNYRNWDAWRDAQMNLFENVLNRHGLEREVMFNTEVHDPNVARFRAKAQEVDRLARAELEKIQVPEPEIRTNPITKKQTVVMSVDEYRNLTKKFELEKASLEAQKSVVQAKLEKTEQKLENFKNKPYVASNERLEAENANLQIQKNELINENSHLRELYLDAKRSANAWKGKFEALESKLETRYESRINELEESNLFLIKRIKNIALKMDAIRSVVDLVKDYFSSDTVQAILEGVSKAIRKYAEENKISNFMENDRRIPREVLQNMPDIGYTYKYGMYGPGIYDKNSKRIISASSYKEARELMPNANIKNEYVSDSDINRSITRNKVKNRGKDRGIER